MTLEAKRCLSCGAGLDEGLSCSYCGTAHVMHGDGLNVACQSCGAGNLPSAKSCVQCRAPLGLPCPECRTFNPLGSRFCQECRIEFKSYRLAHQRVAPNRVSLEEVDAVLFEWLDSRWFKARDLSQHLRVLEKALAWVPRWTFHAKVRGKVQGKVSQTHYRTISVPDRDEEGRRVERVRSVPYKVWEHVSKDVEEAVACARAANSGAGAYDAFVAAAPASPSQPLDFVLGGEPHERVFAPELPEASAFRVLRKQAERELRERLLEQVERLELRFYGPRLTLLFTPVWQVVYRYKGTHGDARIHGVSRQVAGKKLSLFSQWFA